MKEYNWSKMGHMSKYGDLNYWEHRYREQEEIKGKMNIPPEPYDWYQKWKDLSKVLVREDDKGVPTSIIDRHGLILVPGCGTSKLAEDMFDDDYMNITCVDWSETCIRKMSAKYEKNAPNIVYKCKNVLDMGMDDKSYNYIIDKACLDAILCGENSSRNVKHLIQEYYRILNDTGVLILVTVGKPEIRLKYLEVEGYNWKVEQFEPIPKPDLSTAPNIAIQELTCNVHYIYVCTKQDMNLDQLDTKDDDIAGLL
eukprot:Mrub_08151.p2 GENE.Mrub_08151~~Mrub_08151.p2  ORF type:complete len:261 (+),score=60.15 Mrub_08151:23-784(+)